MDDVCMKKVATAADDSANDLTRSLDTLGRPTNATNLNKWGGHTGVVIGESSFSSCMCVSTGSSFTW